MSQHDTAQQLDAWRHDVGGATAVRETVAEETPIALLYNGRPHVVMMATPADLDDFAIGFSLSEGVVASVADVAVVDRLATADGISLQLHVPQAAYDALGDARTLVGRSGCGLCGTDTLAAAIRPVARVTPSPPRDWLPRFADLQAAQQLNAITGAVHAAGVLADDGTLVVREDVGRHNAVDKALGATLRAGRTPRALLVTSRASYEVVHKAAQCGVPLVAAISAPTALAVRLAREAGITLAGFARDGRCTVYAGGPG